MENQRPVLTITKKETTRTKRFYKLSIPLHKGVHKLFDLKTELEYIKENITEKYKNSIPTAIEYVCISDACTHTERLMFLAFCHNGDYHPIVRSVQIDGEHTMMINGGDELKVYPDEYYLERLAKANGYEFLTN